MIISDFGTTISNYAPADNSAALFAARPRAVMVARAAILDRQADLHLAEGRAEHAQSLSHLAFELRCLALEAQP